MFTLVSTQVSVLTRNDINTLVWLDLLEKMTGIKRNGTEDIKVPFDAFTPKALTP